MLNVLKADLYRLYKTKSYYIIAILLCLFTVMYMYAIGGQANGEISAEYLDLTNLVYNVLLNTILVLIMAIEAAAFICADFSSGYIKNMASNVNRKTNIAVSKFITLLIGILIYFILIVLTTYLAGNLLIGKITIDDPLGLCQYVAMAYFLMLVMIALVVLACSFFRNNAASITAITLIILMASLAYMAINQFLGIDLTGISPIMNYQNLAPDNREAWQGMLISGIAFMSIYLIGSSILMERKDII